MREIKAVLDACIKQLTRIICVQYNNYMNSLLWFFFGLGLGLALDFILVLHMLKPLKNRIDKLEAGSND